MTKREQEQELLALTYALSGVTTALEQVPERSAWRGALADAKSALTATLKPDDDGSRLPLRR